MESTPRGDSVWTPTAPIVGFSRFLHRMRRVLRFLCGDPEELRALAYRIGLP